LLGEEAAVLAAPSLPGVAAVEPELYYMEQQQFLVHNQFKLVVEVMELLELLHILVH